MPQPSGYAWHDNMQDVFIRKAKRANIKHLVDLLRASRCKTIGEAKAAYRAKNEMGV